MARTVLCYQIDATFEYNMSTDLIRTRRVNSSYSHVVYIFVIVFGMLITLQKHCENFYD